MNHWRDRNPSTTKHFLNSRIEEVAVMLHRLSGNQQLYQQSAAISNQSAIWKSQRFFSQRETPLLSFSSSDKTKQSSLTYRGPRCSISCQMGSLGFGWGKGWGGWLAAKLDWFRLNRQESCRNFPSVFFFLLSTSFSFVATHTREINPDVVPPGVPRNHVIERSGNNVTMRQAKHTDGFRKRVMDGSLWTPPTPGHSGVPSEPPRSHWFPSF